MLRRDLRLTASRICRVAPTHDVLLFDRGGSARGQAPAEILFNGLVLWAVLGVIGVVAWRGVM